MPRPRSGRARTASASASCPTAAPPAVGRASPGAAAGRRWWWTGSPAWPASSSAGAGFALLEALIALAILALAAAAVLEAAAMAVRAQARAEAVTLATLEARSLLAAATALAPSPGIVEQDLAEGRRGRILTTLLAPPSGRGIAPFSVRAEVRGPDGELLAALATVVLGLAAPP
jgi:type II secretory pathway pseudopilin PulG